MANWPGYTIKTKGNAETVHKIEEILRNQTRDLSIDLNIWDWGRQADLKISGETAWGVHDFDEIVKLVVENKMDLEFKQADIYADDRYYGKWINGEEIEWKEGPYFTEEELKKMESSNDETIDDEVIEKFFNDLAADIEGVDDNE